MNAEPEHFRMVRLHKAWADRYTILWRLIILILFGGIYVFLGEVHSAASDRTDVLVLLAVVVSSTVIWQAVGLGVARVHMLISGIDLEKLKEASRQARK
jgi:hypothetical protein